MNSEGPTEKDRAVEMFFALVGKLKPEDRVSEEAAAEAISGVTEFWNDDATSNEEALQNGKDFGEAVRGKTGGWISAAESDLEWIKKDAAEQLNEVLDDMQEDDEDALLQEYEQEYFFWVGAVIGIRTVEEEDPFA